MALALILRRSAAPGRDLLLLRTDGEARGDRAAAIRDIADAKSVDWLQDGTMPAHDGSVASWHRHAAARIERGVALLSRGRRLVTDRLHADILVILLDIPMPRPLGIYNFSGDLAKASCQRSPRCCCRSSRRPVLELLALLGVAVTGVLFGPAPSVAAYEGADTPSASVYPTNHGFGLLTLIGGLDTATGMGYLLFLPFLIHGRGGNSATAGVALALLFIGGAFGKTSGTWLSEHLGVVGSIVVSEVATASLIVATLSTPLAPTLIVLPLLGIVLNGTSSLRYGTVPEFALGSDTSRAFAIFYTSIIGSGGVAPILCGAIADRSSQAIGIEPAGLTAAAIIPLVAALRPSLRLSD